MNNTINKDDFASIGFFIALWGYLELTIDLWMKKKNLSKKFKRIKKTTQKAGSDFASSNFPKYKNSLVFSPGFSLKIDLLLEEIDEDKRQVLTKIKRKNGVFDLRNRIAHDPMITTIIGALDPGPGFRIKRPESIIINNKKLYIHSVFSFSDIDSLCEELLQILKDLKFKHKHPIDVSKKSIDLDEFN